MLTKNAAFVVVMLTLGLASAPALAHIPADCVPLFHTAGKETERLVRKGQEVSNVAYDELDRRRAGHSSAHAYERLADLLAQLLGGQTAQFDAMTKAIQCADAATHDAKLPADESSPVVPPVATREDCVPKQLSATATETIRLYDELQEFQDEPEFARTGFGQGGPYRSWLVSVENLHADGLNVLRELGFATGDITMLGLEYMGVRSRGQAPTRYLKEMEDRIREGMANATCRNFD